MFQCRAHAWYFPILDDAVARLLSTNKRIAAVGCLTHKIDEIQAPSASGA